MVFVNIDQKERFWITCSEYQTFSYNNFTDSYLFFNIIWQKCIFLLNFLNGYRGKENIIGGAIFMRKCVSERSLNFILAGDQLQIHAK